LLIFRAESWASTIGDSFSLAEDRLTISKEMKYIYMNATQIATPIAGDQQVALLAARLTAVLSNKLQLLMVTRDAFALALQSGNTTQGSIQTVAADLVTTGVVSAPYVQPVDLNLTAVKLAAGESSRSSVMTASAMLNDLWAANKKQDSTIMYQYFASPDGALRYYPAQSWNTSDIFDARLTSWHGAALAPNKKIVILLDSNAVLSSALANLLTSFIQTLSEQDFVGVLSGFSNGSLVLNSSGSACRSDVLLRATVEVRQTLIDTIRSLVGTKAAFDTEAALKQAFPLLANTDTLAGNGYTPILSIFTSTKFPDMYSAVSRLETTYKVEPRVFTYTVGVKKSDDRLELRRLACRSGGAYYEYPEVAANGTSSPAFLASASDYLKLLVPAGGYAAVPPQWLTGIGFRTDLNLGVLLTVVLPVSVNEQVMGVVGMDLALDDLIVPIDQSVTVTSYGFVTTIYGDTLIHPRVNNQGVRVPPYVRDISTFETSDQFASRVRNVISNKQTGSANFPLLRPLIQGDSTFNSERLVPLNAYYYWQQLYTLPFVAVLTYGEEDLVHYDYDVWLPQNLTRYFTGWPLLKDTPYFPPGAVDGTELLDITISAASTTTYTRPGISYGNRTVFIEVHKYLNDLPGAFNPGIDPRVKSEFKVMKLLEQPLRDKWNQYGTSFQLQLIYMGTPSTASTLYPGLPIPGPVLFFNPTRRPWYQLAVANPNKVILTPPYIDSVQNSSVSTLGIALYDDSHTRLIGVAVVDLTYPPMHAFLFGATGCRQRQNDLNSPACFLFDGSGILTTSFRFFDPTLDPKTGKITPIATVFLGEDEPELAQALISDKLLIPSIVDDYTQVDMPARRTFPWSVDETVLGSGTLKGSFSSPCQTGSYFVMKIPISNMYLAIIHDSTFSGRNQSGCPTFTSSSPPVTIPYPICRNSSIDANVRPANAYAVSNNFATLDGLRSSSAKCANVPQAVQSVRASDAGSIVIMVLAAIVIVAIATVLGLLIYLRSTPVMKSSNEMFVYIHLIAIIVGIACLFPWAMRPSSASCVLIIVLGGLGFATAVAVMVAKLIRIQRIVANSTLIAIPISVKDLLLYASVIVAIEAVYIIVWQSVSTLKPGLTHRGSSGTTFVRICTCEHQWAWTGVQIGLFAALVIFGCVLSYATRKVHRKTLWAEPRWIAYSLHLVLILGIVLVLVRALIHEPNTQFVLTGLCICGMGLGTVILVYGVRVYIALLYPNRNESLSVTGSGSTFSTDFRPE